MKSVEVDPNRGLRYGVYFLMIALASGQVAGRILSVQRVYEPSLSRPPDQPNDPRGVWPAVRPVPLPTHGDNDRSRWATVRALVEDGTYAIGRREELPPYGDLRDHEVRALQAGRALAYAASASLGLPGPMPPPPPPYRDVGLMTESGWGTIDKVLHPETKEFYSSKPPLLPTILAGEYWLLREWLGWTMKDEPFVVIRVILFTINWLPFVLYLVGLARLVDELGGTDWGRVLAVAGACFATFLNPFLTTLNNHTLAACGVVFALVPLAGITPEDRGVWWRMAVAGLFTGWTVVNELPAVAFALALFGILLLRTPRQVLLAFAPAAAIPVIALLATNYLAIGEWVPAYEKFGTAWYEFPGSYWAHPREIDAGGDSVGVYAFHLLIGHHGIFSLTPIFLLSLGAMLAAPLSGATPRAMKMVLALSLGLTAYLVLFYLQQTKSYNYGGWTSGPRWFFWLTPLWILSLVPAADWLSRDRWGRGLAYLLLAWSALSAAYPAWNPWRHPWLYNLLASWGLIRY